MRQIKTAYYHQGEKVHTNSAANPNRAVVQCVAHMQVNHYGAQAAEVFDDATGELHAVVKRHMKDGRIEIMYKRNPEDFEPMRLAATTILYPKKN